MPWQDKPRSWSGDVCWGAKKKKGWKKLKASSQLYQDRGKRQNITAEGKIKFITILYALTWLLKKKYVKLHNIISMLVIFETFRFVIVVLVQSFKGKDCSS